MPLRCLSALLFVSAMVSGQGTQGLLKGRIVDPRGGAIPNAAVEIRNQETLSLRAMTSGADGYFIAPNLQAAPIPSQ